MGAPIARNSIVFGGTDGGPLFSGAVREFKLDCHDSETIFHLFDMHNMVILDKFLSSNYTGPYRRAARLHKEFRPLGPKGCFC